MPPLPVVSGVQRVAVLVHAGFLRVSQKGSHVKLRAGDRTVIVPLHAALAPGTLKSVLRQAGWSVLDLHHALHA
jgi:predicted RNA binding protein YcfA (HicA-like mRNA interferase family)